MIEVGIERVDTDDRYRRGYFIGLERLHSHWAKGIHPGDGLPIVEQRATILPDAIAA